MTNRLEFVDGYATGRLLPPMMAAATKASWMRIYAEKEKLNLSDCYGYSDSMSDLPMLSVVGHPTAVNPDIRLRNTALQHDWPILDLTMTCGHLWGLTMTRGIENEMRERAPKVLRGPVPRNKEDDQVVYIDSDSAPRILFSGEDLLLEDLPIGTRVIYPKPPIEGLANPGAAIRYALNHPLEARIRSTRSWRPGCG